VVVIAGGLGYTLHAARAGGIPSSGPLVYTGILTDAAGVPLPSPQNIGVAVYDAQSAGNKVCESAAQQRTLDPAGRFQVAMPDTCVAAVAAHPDSWVEVSLAGTPLGRSKIGAVPYAVEANNAMQLQGMSPSQLNAALATRVTALETALQSTTTATAVMDNLPGPFGATGIGRTFQCKSGDLILIVSATAFLATTPEYQLDVAVQFDGSVIGHLKLNPTRAMDHLALPTKAFRVSAPAAGNHTITLLAGNTNTLSDSNDYFSVTVIQAPH